MTARRPRVGSVLVVAFALLLVACVVVRAQNVAEASRRVTLDRHLFARYARSLPGRFGPATVSQHKASDVVCAPRRPAPRGRLSYKLCIVVTGSSAHPHVAQVYSSRSHK
jgi:hypothetical protein